MYLKKFGVWAAFFAVMILGVGPTAAQDIPEPEANREFRAVWVATVANIDWPSRPGLSTADQQAEIIAILDRCAELKLNAVVLQVRPAADAIYPSELEPWSAVITGTMGQAPEPFYDPLKMWVDEAHKRGIELHCWLNPYRALHSSHKGEISEKHIVKTNPDMAPKYGKYYWLNPTDQRVQDLSIDVFMDVVNRYDIDGIHMDDYFYPYPSYADGADFPDDKTWAAYQESGGKLDRDDWRRDAVNKFVERLYNEVKQAKPHVKVGISPFGIARPGKPPEVASGFDQYAQLYADAELWLNKGWVDYYTPQLYWPVASKQPFMHLLKWWMSENHKDRHVWPGLYTSRLVGNRETLIEVPTEIAATRFLGANGHVHFSMKPLMKNTNGINELLKDGNDDWNIDAMYGEPALIPASPWLDDLAPVEPKLTVDKPTAGDTGATKSLTLNWKMGNSDEPWLWVVYALEGKRWSTRILSATSTTLKIEANKDGDLPARVAVSAVDRNGNESEKAMVELSEVHEAKKDDGPVQDQVK